MTEDVRKKYLEELMQPHIPLRVLQEIRQEIYEIEDTIVINPDSLYDRKSYLRTINVMDIIDKHIKEIEGSDKE